MPATRTAGTPAMSTASGHEGRQVVGQDDCHATGWGGRHTTGQEGHNAGQNGRHITGR